MAQSKSWIISFLLVAGLSARATPLVGVDFASAARFFDSAAPGTLGMPQPFFTPGPGELVHASDFIDDGTMFVWVSAPGSIYRLLAFMPRMGVNPDPVQIGPTHVITGPTKWGMAANSDGTRFYLASNAGHNFRIENPSANKVDRPTLAYAAGDVNAGVTPKVGALVQVMPDFLLDGKLYAVDAATTSWVRLNPETGELTTIAALALGETPSQSTFYNLAQVNGAVFLSAGDPLSPTFSKLYSVDRFSGAATLLGTLEGNTILRGLGVEPSAPPPPPPAYEVIWDAGRDMKLNEKPDTATAYHDDTDSRNNRVPEWSYGYRSLPTGTNLVLFAANHHTNGSGATADLEGFDPGTPHVIVNVGDTDLTWQNPGFPFLPIPLRPGELVLHPAMDHRVCVVRWTCPFEREYSINAYWEDMDPYGGDGCSTHIVINGVEVYLRDYNNGGTSATNVVRTLMPGDVVDFVLGTRGSSAVHDSARANFTISAAPRDLAWDGGTGPTGDETNWNPDFQPQRLDTVRIETGDPLADSELSARHLINTESVTFTNGLWNIYGSLTNDGSLRLHDDVIRVHGNVGIYGGGNVFMQGAELAAGQPDAHILFNLGNRIQGYGGITARFNNQSNGVVVAQQGGALAVDNLMANHGIMSATAGSWLYFNGEHDAVGPAHNGGGLIRALFDGSVYLAGPISGGEIANQQNLPGAITGAVQDYPQQIRAMPTAGVFLGNLSDVSAPLRMTSDYGATTLSGVDLNGDAAEFTLPPNRQWILDGDVNLFGTVRAYGNTLDGRSRITLQRDVTVSGAGDIQLGWAGKTDEITGAGHRLTLAGSTLLSGGGHVRVPVTTTMGVLANRSSSTAGSYPLEFHEEVFCTTGLLGASDGGTLRFRDVVRLVNATGTSTGWVMNATGGSVDFVEATVIGGVLESFTGQSAFQYRHSQIGRNNEYPPLLRGQHETSGEAADTLRLHYWLRFEDGATLSIRDDCLAMTEHELLLSGRGLVWLRGNNAALEIPFGDKVINRISIAGLGEISGGGRLVNFPTDGRVQAFAGTLDVSTEVENHAVLEAGGRPSEGQGNSPGTLMLRGHVTQPDAASIIRVNNPNSRLFLRNASVFNGLIETAGDGTGYVDTYGRLQDLSLRNNLRAIGATRCDVAGTLNFLPGLFSESYLVAGGNVGEAASEIGIEGTVTLDGSGGIWLVSPATNDPTLARIVPADNNAGTAERIVLRDGARLRGHGMVSVPVRNESGEILADTPGGTLRFMPGTLESVNPVQTFNSDQITANPDLVLPAVGATAARALNQGILEINDAVVANQRLVADGAGKIVFNAISPVFDSVRIALRGTAEMVMTNGMQMVGGLNISVLGNEATALPGASSCGIPHVDLGSGPTVRIGGELIGNSGNTVVDSNGVPLIGLDGGSMVAAGGGNVLSHNGGTLKVSGNAGIVADRGGKMVAAGAGNLEAKNGGAVVAKDGGAMVAAGGLNLVAAGGGNLVAAGGGNLVAAGGGNLVAAGGGNLVAAGGGNIANAGTGNMVAAGGLNGAPAYGILQVKGHGRLRMDGGNAYIDGGSRNTTMVENQVNGRVDAVNGSCLKVPHGRMTNNGTLNAKNSNVVTGFFVNVGNAVVSGVTWAWNGTVGVVTGVVNGVGGVINSTGSLFKRIFGLSGQPGSEGFALSGASLMDPSDFINEGTFILGDGITTNTVDMGFTQTNTGRLCVQIGGTTTNDHDCLFINGPAVLGGVLELVFTNNFAPAQGDVFDFLVCPDVVGNFDSVEIAGLPAGHNWQYHAVFTNGAYRVVSDSTVVLPLAAFRALHGLPADGAQDFANPSGDRIPNLLKYAFNLAENAGDLSTPNYRLLQSATDTAGLPSLFRTDNGVFQFVFVRRAEASVPGITYTPEISTSLDAGWVDLVPDSEVVQPLGGVWERVILTLAAPFDPPHDSGGRVRVRVDRR